jgi:hypothetical protein
MYMRSRSAAEELVNAVEAFIAAHILSQKLKNPESGRALDKARGALIDILERS